MCILTLSFPFSQGSLETGNQVHSMQKSNAQIDQTTKSGVKPQWSPCIVRKGKRTSSIAALPLSLSFCTMLRSVRWLELINVAVLRHWDNATDIIRQSTWSYSYPLCFMAFSAAIRTFSFVVTRKSMFFFPGWLINKIEAAVGRFGYCMCFDYLIQKSPNLTPNCSYCQV